MYIVIMDKFSLVFAFVFALAVFSFSRFGSSSQFDSVAFARLESSRWGTYVTHGVSLTNGVYATHGVYLTNGSYVTYSSYDSSYVSSSLEFYKGCYRVCEDSVMNRYKRSGRVSFVSSLCFTGDTTLQSNDQFFGLSSFCDAEWEKKSASEKKLILKKIDGQRAREKAASNRRFQESKARDFQRLK